MDNKSIYPIVTKDKQKIYEEMYLENKGLNHNIPVICGYYGRACRNMDEPANSMLCNGCTLALFVSVVEAILERCNEKEKKCIKHLFNNDIQNVQEKLKEKRINVDYSYIESVAQSLNI